MGIKSDISENTDNKRSTDKNINEYLVKVEEPGKSLNKRPGVWLIIGTEKKKNENINDGLTEEKKPNKLYAKEPEVWSIIGLEMDKTDDKLIEVIEADQEPNQEPVHKSDHSRYICLQVAKTKDIWKEMREDWGMLDEKKPKPELKQKKWVNQFGEFQFEYYDQVGDMTRKWLYHHIAVNYENIKFVCVAYGNKPSKDKKSNGKQNDGIQNDGLQSMNDKDNRSVLEKYIACSTFAKFWRDKAPFKEERPHREKQSGKGKNYKGKVPIEDIKQTNMDWCNDKDTKTTIANILRKTKKNKIGKLDLFLKIIRVPGDELL